MRTVLALLILALPIAEIVTIAMVGKAIGFWPTFGLLLAAGMLGGLILNAQGLATLRRLHVAMERGETPILPAFEGLLLAIAGLLLIAPGFISDVLGLALLIPPLRKFVATAALRWFARHGEVRFGAFGARTQTQTQARDDRPTAADGPVIEGEFTRIGERTIDPARGRGEGGDGRPR